MIGATTRLCLSVQLMQIYISKKMVLLCNILRGNVSVLLSITLFWTVLYWLKFIDPTKFTWDLHDLVETIWNPTNKRECVEKLVLDSASDTL